MARQLQRSCSTLRSGRAVIPLNEFFAEEFCPRGTSGRGARELLPFALVRHAASRVAGYDVVEATGPLGWVAFPLLRLRRQQTHPLFVARSYGLEHFDHQVRVEERRAGRLELSWAYRFGGGFLTLREVEIAVAASDVFAAPRPGAAQLACRRKLKSERECLVSGFGVSDAYLSAPTRRQADSRRIAWVGTRVERKGWRYFVAGLSRAMDSDAHMTGAVFGTRSDAEAVLGDFPASVRSRITVYGLLDERSLIAELGQCSCFVSTSLSEGYHLALLQAMAVGLPVIATSEGFLGDLPPSRGAWDGIYRAIEKRSAESLACALTELKDPNLVGRYAGVALRGKAFARRRSWRHVADETAAAYEWHIARRLTRRAPTGPASAG